MGFPGNDQVQPYVIFCVWVVSHKYQLPDKIFRAPRRGTLKWGFPGHLGKVLSGKVLPGEVL